MSADVQAQKVRAHPLWRFAPATLAALGAAIAASLVLLALNFASAMLPRAPIAAAVRGGFAERQLQDYGWLRLNPDIGVHQFNDCLILLMAVDDRAPAAKRALSPTIAGASVGAYGGGFKVPCPPLRAFVNGAQAPLNDASFYHRYVFGNVALTAALLQFSSIKGLRTAFGGLALIAPLLLLRLSLGRLVRAGPTQPGVATLGLAAFYGLMLAFFFAAQYFGQSIAHFPADILLTLYLVGIVRRGDKLGGFTGLGIYNALFGALTMYFEFLSGGAPMGASLVLATAAAQAIDRKEANALPRLAFALITFGIGFVAIYAIKQIATVMVFGNDVFSSSGARLETWLGGATPFETFARLAENLRELGGGSQWIGVGLVLGAATALVASIVKLTRGKTSIKAPEWGFVAAALVIPVWYLIFALHTYVHAWMMIRIVVGFNAASYFLLFVVYRDAFAGALARLSERWRGVTG
jgi:hypothetical protein